MDLTLWNHYFAFLLVGGAALEAIFKAAAMQATMNAEGLPGIVTAEPRRLQKWFKTHRLDKIAKRAQIPVSELEEAQLRRFTKYVVWAGSYPVPQDLIDPRPNAEVIIDFNISNFDRVWFDRLYVLAEETYQRHKSASEGA